MNTKNRKKSTISFGLLLQKTTALQHAVEEQFRLESGKSDTKAQSIHRLYQGFSCLFTEQVSPFCEHDSETQMQAFAEASGQILLYTILLARWKFAQKSHGIFSTHTIKAYIPPCFSALQEWCCLWFDIVGGVVGIAIADLVEVVARLDGIEKHSIDGMVQLYEKFLAVYNKQRKKSNGVYYTPQVVVDAMVRSIDVQLKTQFGLSLGIASVDTWEDVFRTRKMTSVPNTIHPQDVFVQILDPATGTGIFVLSVIRKIRNNLYEHWLDKGWSQAQMQQEWNAYVSGGVGIDGDYRGKSVWSRLFACEVMVVPYCLAHFHVGIVLEEEPLPYSLAPTDMPQIRWCSYLEQQVGATGIHTKNITVILGNPPYSHISQQKNAWIQAQIQAYKHIEGKSLGKKICLDDDYIKFIRVAEMQITRTGLGLVHFITPHGFLDAKNFRGMRHTLLQSFDQMYFFDLHGNINRKERVSGNSIPEENIFAIKQGVVISMFMKTCMFATKYPALASVWFGEQYGTASKKVGVLESISDITRLCIEELLVYNANAAEQSYLFRPQIIDRDVFIRYHQGFSLQELFLEKVVGIQTGADPLCVAFSKEELQHRMYGLYRSAIRMLSTGEFILSPDTDISLHYATSLRLQHCVRTVQEWYTNTACIHNLDQEKWERCIREEIALHIKPMQYRALDYRWVFFHSAFLHRDRRKIQQHLLHSENIGVVFSSSVVGNYTWQDILLSDTLVELGVMATRPSNGAPIAPLYVYTNDGTQTNLSPVVVGLLEKCLSVPWMPEKSKDSEDTSMFGPMDVVYYVIAVLYSPRYREKYTDLLVLDAPKVPYPSDSDTFWSLIRKGRELSGHLLLGSAPSATEVCGLYHVHGQLLVESEEISVMQFVSLPEQDSLGKICINSVSYVDGVHVDIWNMWIGGYQPVQRWLQDRKGRKLSKEELVCYQQLLYSVQQIHRLMQEIDGLLLEM